MGWNAEVSSPSEFQRKQIYGEGYTQAARRIMIWRWLSFYIGCARSPIINYNTDFLATFPWLSIFAATTRRCYLSYLSILLANSRSVLYIYISFVAVKRLQFLKTIPGPPSMIPFFVLPPSFFYLLYILSWLPGEPAGCPSIQQCKCKAPPAGQLRPGSQFFDSSSLLNESGLKSTRCMQ